MSARFQRDFGEQRAPEVEKRESTVERLIAEGMVQVWGMAGSVVWDMVWLGIV